MQDENDNWPLLEGFRAAREGRPVDVVTDDTEVKAGIRAAIRIKALMSKPRGSRSKATMSRFR